MAIKMRHNANGNAVCCSCGARTGEVLGMYDIKIGSCVLTICDACNQELLNKTLSAEAEKNGRIKSSRDMAIIRQRHNGTYTKGGVSNGSKLPRYSIQYDA